MVPSQWLVLDALPVNGAGKVDRKALPVPEWQGRPYRAPQGELETTLAAIWAEVLKLDQVGRDDHFFELGGHSLLATQVTARIQQRLARTVPLKTLFQAPTLADFAAAVAGQSDSAKLLPLERRAPGARVPLTPAQQELWLLAQLDPDSTAWNLACAYRCHGHLDRAGVQWAFDALVERHVALRTTFRVAADGEVEQWVHAPHSPTLAYTDLSALPPAERDAEARRLTDEEDVRPFDLPAGPLLRVGLIRLADDEQVLLISVHHSMTDGLSMSVLFDEFAELYRARLAGLAPQLPALAVDYADFALWQRESFDAAARERELAYWLKQLEGMPLMALPMVPDAPALPKLDGEQHYFELEPTLAEYARAFALRHGTSLSMVLQAALNVALYRHAGALDQGIGIISATRPRLEAERLVGLLFNMQVLRSRLDPAQGFTAVLDEVKQAALGAHAHPELPFHELVAALRPPRHGAPCPLFRVLYNFQRPDNVGLAPLPGIQIEDFSAVRRTVVSELEFNVVEHPDGRVTAAFAYAVEVIDGVFARALAADYPLLLARLLAEPERALADFAAPHGEVSDGGQGTSTHAPLAVPPRNSLEIALAALWSELLGVADIGIYDNFFTLGGDSMLTLKLAARARQQGIALSVAQLFTHQTIAALAAALATSHAVAQPALA
jgi:aryl carrier-like protein